VGLLENAFTGIKDASLKEKYELTTFLKVYGG